MQRNLTLQSALLHTLSSGTVSQLVDSASGIHARHNAYYIRTVRADNKDPLCAFMKDAGFKRSRCNEAQHTTVLFDAESKKCSI